MQTLQQKLRQLGLADFLDMNIPQGKMQTQITLLKRLLSQAKLSDVLDANLNAGQLKKQLEDISKVPVTVNTVFKTANLPVPPEIKDLVQHIQVAADTHSAIASLDDLKARMSALADFLSTVKIGADDTSALKTIAGLQAKLTAMANGLSSVKINADATALIAKLAALQAQETKLAGTLANMPVSGDITAMESKLAALQAQASRYAAKLANMPADANIVPMEAKLSIVQARAEQIAARLADMPASVDIASMQAKLSAVQAQIALITSKLENIKGGIDVAGLTAAITQMWVLESVAKTLMETLSSGAAAADAWNNAAGISAAEAAIKFEELAHAAKDAGDQNKYMSAVQAANVIETSKVGDAAKNSALQFLAQAAATGRAADASNAAKSAYSALGNAVGHAGEQAAASSGFFKTFGAAMAQTTPILLASTAGWFGLLSRVNLFAGIGGRTVSVLHLLADAVIEAGISIGLAIIGVAALAAAVGIFIGVATLAQDTLGRISDRLKAVQTASSATGQAISPMTNAFDNLAHVIRPQVWQLYGDALNLVGGKLGLLGGIATKTGAFIDQLAGKVIAFINQPSVQQGFANLIKTGVAFAEQFGRIILNLGTAIVNFIKVAQMTHIAESLLLAVNAIATLIKWLSELPAPLLAAAVALHAVYLWGGLFATLVVKMIDPLRALALAMGGVSVASTELAANPAATGLARLKAVITDVGTGFSAIPGRITGTTVAMKDIASVVSTATVPELESLMAYSKATGLAMEAMVPETLAAQIETLGTGMTSAGKAALYEAAAAGATSGELKTLAASNAVAATSSTGLLASIQAFGTASLATTADLAVLDAGEGIATVATLTLAGALSALETAFMLVVTSALFIPVVIAAVVAAFAFVTYKIFTANDATQQWINKTNQALAASSQYKVIGQTVADLAATTQKLADTQHGAAGNAGELAAAQNDLSGKLSTELIHVGQVSKSYGTDMVGALNLLQTAGVKTSAIFDKNNKTWAAAMVQVAGLVKGYQAMGQGLSMLQNDVSVQLVSNADQLKSMQKLNTAWDTWTKLIAAPMDGVLTLSQNLSTFSKDAQAAGASMAGLAGDVLGASKKVKTSSVQLQQDFQASFSSVQQLFDAFRSSQAVTGKGDFTGFVKDAVAALIPLAANNKAAAAEVSALAQEAGGPATTSLSALAKWAGNVKNPMDALYTASQNATVATSNLSQDAATLTTTLQQDLNPAMASAAFNALGGQKAFNTFASDLVNFGPNAQPTITAGQAVAKELLSISKNSDQAKAQFVGWAESMGLSKDAAEKLWKQVDALPKNTVLNIRAEMGVTKSQIADLQKKVDNSTGKKKLSYEVDLKDAQKKLQMLAGSITAGATSSDQLRKGLAKGATAGDNLARSGFWGQVKDKIVGIGSTAKNHPIATLFGGLYNMIPGVTGALDKVGGVVTNFFTKTIPNVAKAGFNAVAGFFTGPVVNAFDDVKRAISRIWDQAWADIVSPVVHAFDKLKTFISSSFDAWWKTHGDEIKQVWKAVWGAIVSIATGVWDNIKAPAISAWNVISGLWKNGGKIFNGISDAAKAVWSFITGIAKQTWADIVMVFGGPAKFLWSGVVGAAKIAWDTVVGVAKAAWGIITGAVEAGAKIVWDALAASAKIAWAAIVLIAKVTWDTIVAIISVALDVVTGHWSRAWNDIKNWGLQVFNAFKDAFTTVFNSIVTVAKQVWNSIYGFFSTNFVQPLISFFGTTLPNAIKGIGSSFSTAWNEFWSIFVAPIMNFFLKTIPGWFTDIFGSLWGVALSTAWGEFTQFLIAPVVNFFSSTLPGWFDHMASYFATKATAIWNSFYGTFISPSIVFWGTTFPNWITSVASWFATKAKAIWNSFYGTFIAPNIVFWGTTFPNWITSIANWFATKATALWNSFYGTFISPVVNFFKNTLPGAIESGLLKGLQTVVRGINIPINFINNSILSHLPGNLSIPTVPVPASLATGGQIRGGIPGKDSVMGMLMPGEVVVPTHMVKAGAVDHLKGRLPGFAAGGMVNPIGAGLRPERIDQGVDYGGSGPLYAISHGTITNLYNSGWTGGTFIGERMDQGTKAGQYWYLAEDIAPLTNIGATVSAGQHIANATGGGSGIEVGFAAPPGSGTSMANATGQGAGSTGWGEAASALISSLGGPAGILQGKGGQGTPGVAGGLGFITQLWQNVEGLLNAAGDALSGNLAPLAGYVQGGASSLLALAKKGAKAVFDGIWNHTVEPLVDVIPAQTLPGAGLRAGMADLKTAIDSFFTAQDNTAQASAASANASGGGGGVINPVSGPADASPGTAANYAKGQLGAHGWGGGQWPPLQKLWDQESGFSRMARNPSSGAYGIPQALPASKLPAAGQASGGSHASPQIDWGLNYIAGRYKDPAGAWAHEVANNWYSQGGRVPGYATGGAITGAAATALRANLGKEQASELKDYASIPRDFASSLAKAKKGSWTAAHAAGIKGELATLAKRQAAEKRGYGALAGAGLTSGNLSKFATAAGAEVTVSKDLDLTQGHPMDMRNLASDLGILGSTATTGKTAATTIASAAKAAAVTKAAPSTSASGQYTEAAMLAAVSGHTMAQIQASPHLSHLWHLLHTAHLATAGQTGTYSAPAATDTSTTTAATDTTTAATAPVDTTGIALRSTISAGQSAETSAYASMVRALHAALANPVAGSFAAANLPMLNTDLSALVQQQAAEASAFRGLPGTTLATNDLVVFGQALRTLTATANDPALTTAVPAAAAALQTRLAELGAVSGYADGGMVFDNGGVLPSGKSLVWNKTGKPEPLTPAQDNRAAYATTPGHAAPMTAGETAIIAALERVAAAVSQQNTSLGTTLSGTAAMSAQRGRYRTR